MRSALAACFAALVLVGVGGCGESAEEPTEPSELAAGVELVPQQ